ncbi:MAG: hypothetical protein Q9222_003421 [Ikaeria aurantiellina]
MVYGSLHNAGSQVSCDFITSRSCTNSLSGANQVDEKDLTSPHTPDKLPDPIGVNQWMPTIPPSATLDLSNQSLIPMLANDSNWIQSDAPLDPAIERELTRHTESRLQQLQADFRSQIALIDEHQRTIEGAKRTVEEHQRIARDLKEEINFMELSLGIAQPEVQTQADKPLDQHLPPDNEAAYSPGATTLVENTGEAPYEALVPELEVAANLEGRSSDESIKDVPTEALVPENEHEEVSIAVDDRKRKRFSKFMSAKKARMSRTDLSTSHHPKERRSQQELLQDKNTGAPLDDDTKPPATSRPISWPRSRLFRRSAGVSVKKLTEVFEKLKPYQNNDTHMD